MANFPSEWLDFSNNKEIKRLRSDINDTFSLKFQIALSVITAILSFHLDKYLQCACIWVQISACVGLCAVVVLIFVFPEIVKFFKVRRRCNVIIKGKDAVSIFDDEIVYYVLVACEYFNAKESVPKSNLQDHIVKFYEIEIAYYVSESIKRLHDFSSNITAIFGSGDNKIPFVRVSNIVSMIGILTEQSGIEIQNSLLTNFTTFKNTIESLETHMDNTKEQKV